MALQTTDRMLVERDGTPYQTTIADVRSVASAVPNDSGVPGATVAEALDALSASAPTDEDYGLISSSPASFDDYGALP
jgi:hypothetical protein